MYSKKLAFALFMQIGVMSNGYSQLQSILSESSLYVTDISVQNNDTSFFACSTKILRTYNGGVSFDTILSPSNFWSIDFCDVNNGVASGQNGIIKTIDGGNNWDTLFTAPSFSSYLDIHIINPNKIVVSTTTGYIIGSMDGGSTWDTLAFPNVCSSTGVPLWRFSFLNEKEGYLGANCMGVVQTLDSGQTWNTLFWNSSYSFRDISFINSQFGWAVDDGIGPFNHLFYTIDSNVTWQFSSAFDWEKYKSLDFDSVGIGIVVSDILVICTHNSGNNWDTVPNPNNYGGFTTTELINDSSAFVGGSNGIYKISNFPVGIKNNLYSQNKFISVFPTFFENVITIKTTSQTSKKVNFDLINPLGEKIISFTSKENFMKIDLSYIKNGIYFLTASCKEKRQVIKLMKY